jgi:hypothetical protein
MTERKQLSPAEAAFFQAKFRAQELERRAFAEQYGEASAPMVVSVGGKLISQPL